jgi:hypothetical protein
LVRDVADDLIYHHSRRVFLFASLRVRHSNSITIRNWSTSVQCSTILG